MSTHTVTCIHGERLCVCVCVIMYIWCECAGSGGGALRLMGSFCGMSLLAPVSELMRWANMKSKWKRPTKGWKEDD